MNEESREPENPNDKEESSMESPPPFFASGIDRSEDKEVEVTVVGVFEHSEPGLEPNTEIVNRFVLVRDNHDRSVPILIGSFEAMSITYALENEAPDRPITHDIMKIMIEKFRATLDRVLIDDLWSEVFYAKIYITMKDNQTMEIDCRPSDAIALALRFKAPILISESVLDATRAED